MSALLHCAMSRTCLQPKGSEVSTPRMTASLPCSMTWRAWALSVTIRNQPFPAPPYILSTKACMSYVSLACRRMDVISSQLRSLKKYTEQITPLVTRSLTSTRWPPRQARSTQA